MFSRAIFQYVIILLLVLILYSQDLSKGMTSKKQRTGASVPAMISAVPKTSAPGEAQTESEGEAVDDAITEGSKKTEISTESDVNEPDQESLSDAPTEPAETEVPVPKVDNAATTPEEQLSSQVVPSASSDIAESPKTSEVNSTYYSEPTTTSSTIVTNSTIDSTDSTSTSSATSETTTVPSRAAENYMADFENAMLGIPSPDAKVFEFGDSSIDKGPKENNSNRSTDGNDTSTTAFVSTTFNSTSNSSAISFPNETTTVNSTSVLTAQTENSSQTPALNYSSISNVSTTSTLVSTSTIISIKNDTLYNCSHLTCVKNESLFLDGNLKEPNRYGTWLVKCNRLLLFGTIIVNWETNVQKCCSIGMVPLTIDAADISACYKDLIVSKWKYNWNYWTSGRKTSISTGTYQFCFGKTSAGAGSTISSFWAKTQPNNTNMEQCVHININSLSKEAQLHDRNCSHRYIFGCQGSTTTPPPCQKATCPLKNCTNTPSLFDNTNPAAPVLKNSSIYGTWSLIKGRWYLFSSATSTWAEAFDKCCSIGMKLLSLDISFEQQNVWAAKIAKATITDGYYWTSGAYDACKKNYTWCAEYKYVLRNATWAQGQPSTTSGNCVSLNFGASSAVLEMSDCTKIQKFICEVRNTTGSIFPNKAVQDECAANYQITEAEILVAMTSKPTDTRLKCFIKCMGEMGSLMYDGAVIPQELYKLAEETESEETSLQSSFDAIDQCSASQHADECETAGAVFSCGQDQAPNYISNSLQLTKHSPDGLISDTSVLSGSLSISPASSGGNDALARTVPLCLAFRFKKHVPFIKAYTSGAVVANFFVLPTCGTQKYLLYTVQLPYTAAAEACALMGFYLASIETKAEFDCIVAMSVGPRPFMLLTSGSSIGKQDLPVWCSTGAFVKTSLFSWNAPTGGLFSTDPTKSLIYIYAASTLSGSYMVNQKDSGIGFPLCESP